MKNYAKIEVNGNLESMVYTLLAAKARGENVYCEFGGKKIYSDSVSMDSAYLEVYGVTKAQWDAEMERERIEAEKRKQEANDSIPAWIEKGKALIFPERHEEWEKCVEVRAHDLYNGMELNHSLELMEALENGVDIEDVKKIFDNQGHSGMSASIVRSILFTF